VTTFSSAGFSLVPRVMSPAKLQDLSARTEMLQIDGPGTRNLLTHPWCREVAAELGTSPALAAFIPSELRAVQCTYFEKSAVNNWLVPVHQDLSVPVAGRTASSGWGPWSTKEGETFVQPPIAVLEELVAVRLHLDPCTANDGPLFVVPGTHLRGVISPDDAVALRAREQVCLAGAGDALVFRPLLLHRSSKGSGASRRRVLHFLFAPPCPAPGLAWQGAA
jgi:Phytanoyl-CoA dioxygenase (PhyH)